MGIQAFKSVAKQRARLVGQLKKLELRILTDNASVPELRAKIHSYDEVLRSQGIDVDPDIFAPAVTPTPRRKYFAHGELTSLCLAALRTESRALTTVELLDALVCAKKITWRSVEDRSETRRGIKDAMRVQVKRGIVTRVGVVGTGHDKHALWTLA
ncbi:MAG: hypothetical protein ACXWU9_03400 [Telluria sp.]